MSAIAEQSYEQAREEQTRSFRNAMTEHLRAHTDGTNVNTETLLATDYLNTFNEVVMLLEMLPAAPAELMADLERWRTKSYQEHFMGSGFRDRDLAIAAYDNAPEQVRRLFDAAIGTLERQTCGLVEEILALAKAGDSTILMERCMQAVPRLQSLIQDAAAVVNGDFPVLVACDGDSVKEDSDAQSKIDALFD